jgi:hypothetical protein
MPTKNTIDDASHQEWSEAGQTPTDQKRRDWYAESAKIEGDACVGAGLPSGIAPCENQAPSARSLWPDGCLEVSSAEALLLRWHLEAEQMDKHAKHWGETNDPTIAGLCKGTSDGIRKCLQELRREMGLPYPRQPQDNGAAQTRRI